MPSNPTTERPASLEKLQEQVDDLADYVARVVNSLYTPDQFRHWERADSGVLLEWHEELSDEGTEDERFVGWWRLVASEARDES